MEAARMRRKRAEMDSFDWNDLRHFLAVAGNDSTTAAARVLGVSQSTVHRRLAELERCLGQELFIRHSGGIRLSEFGQHLQPMAQRVDEAVAALQRHVAA